jgi:ABC-type multidrug transport system fused ATPase/permease subunit
VEIRQIIDAVEVWQIIDAVIVVCAIFAFPWLRAKLAQPGWAVVEFFVIFALLTMVLALLLPISASIVLAFTVAIIRYENRAKAAQAEEDSKKGTESAAQSIQPHASGDSPKKE